MVFSTSHPGTNLAVLWHFCNLKIEGKFAVQYIVTRQAVPFPVIALFLQGTLRHRPGRASQVLRTN
jgi:hypothetical protein